MIIGKFDVDIFTELPLVVPVSQDDVGLEIAFSVWDGTEAYMLTSATLTGKKPSGQVFVCGGTVTDNIATFTLTADMTDEAGDVLCEIACGNRKGTKNFIMRVEVKP